MNPNELKDPPRQENELVRDHMLKALFNLQMAYNAVSNAGAKDNAWGLPRTALFV